MKKFKAYYNHSCGSDNHKKLLDTFSSAVDAANCCISYAKEEGDLYDCDNREEMISALVDRGFYMVGYGPREMSIEEVDE